MRARPGASASVRAVTGPLSFSPLFMERVWGGRRLESLFGKPLPPGAVIGESWEVVDRPEAQSVVAAGPLAGRSLHDLWAAPDGGRERLFGARATGAGDRFPLLIKLLDCEQTLSVQVHPPAAVASSPCGEPKTEMWVILDAEPGAHLFAGLRRGVTRERFEDGLRAGEDVSELLQRVEVDAGDVMFLPSGRVHAIGAGNVICEIQQNSDTTYRLFDFNRLGLDGRPRELHVERSLESIDWTDAEPALVEPDGDVLVSNDVFHVERWSLEEPRAAAPEGECAILAVLDGAPECGGSAFAPGSLFLVPAEADDLTVSPGDDGATVLQITLPARSA